jgi:hypothetical protein
MSELNLDELRQYVNTHIDNFHQAKIHSIERMSLNGLLKKKNPYLFKAKNILLAQDFVLNLLNAHISSSEEELFGAFLEGLAKFIATKTSDVIHIDGFGRFGIDLELIRGGKYLLIQIKSGTNWGNSSQQARQKLSFIEAVAQVRSEQGQDIEIYPILGICYGKTKTVYTYNRTAIKVVGQNFWYLISGIENLYLDIIEPLGYKAKEHTEAFEKQKAQVVNNFTAQFMEEFCDAGLINWERITEFNSGNLDLPAFFTSNKTSF